MKHNGWGDKLHNFIRRLAQNLAIALQTPQNLVVPNICKYNQKITMLKAKFKEGKDLRLVVPIVTVEPNMHFA
jgi:hypothetical protein